VRNVSFITAILLLALFCILLLPGSGFLCEEEDLRDLDHEYIWIIDPIDGTANYARGSAAVTYSGLSADTCPQSPTESCPTRSS
jgi:3'-phosphoadenosine 5'-phosphosulfate (PAPS) 3'-phosphatase